MAALSGRRAVVTGAAGGIGGAVVRQLVADGAFVHAVDRDRAGLDRLQAEWPGAVIGHAADLADRAAVDDLVRRLQEASGKTLHILINGAGLSRVEPFASSDDALLDRLFAVNFTAAFRLTRGLLPALRTGGRGSAIVNIASELALVGQSGYSAYAASKGALLSWSRTLAVELAAEGIRVNTVCPGPVDTSMLAREFATATDPAAARREETASIPLGRLGEPAEIAAVIAFLSSHAAAFVSGATWSVDGGKTAR